MLEQSAEDKKAKVKAKIKSLISKGIRFGVVVDEWTCKSKNRRYLNVCLHTKGCSINLGMEPVDGSMPAPELERKLRNRLESFDVDIDKDVIGISCDGCSLMVKLGENLDIDQQLCFSHCRADV